MGRERRAWLIEIHSLFFVSIFLHHNRISWTNFSDLNRTSRISPAEITPVILCGTIFHSIAVIVSWFVLTVNVVLVIVALRCRVSILLETAMIVF